MDGKRRRHPQLSGIETDLDAKGACMIRTVFLLVGFILGGITPSGVAQVRDFVPVTREMLLNPSPNDWLMYSRTYDNQRFSPLDQINRQNASQLRLAWARGMSAGIHEHIPLVYPRCHVCCQSGRTPSARRHQWRPDLGLPAKLTAGQWPQSGSDDHDF